MSNDITSEEHAVIAMDPRCGLSYPGGVMLSQEDTDMLIATELHGELAFIDDEARGLLTAPMAIAIKDPRSRALRRVSSQRGGIHSDAIIRLLAYRQWQRRDLDGWLADDSEVGLRPSGACAPRVRR